MNENEFATGSVPVMVAARIYGKDASWVRAGIISGWLPIRQKNHQEFIFTFNNEGNWRFETVESFMNGLRGGKK